MLKIVLAGLDNAGKSSLLLTINRKFSHLPSLAPTRGTERTRFDYFGKKIIGFDLGGQKAYRDDYIARPELFFAETDLLFYVIDLQDPERFVESAEYFSKILEALVKLDATPQIVVACHKFDPDVQKGEAVQENLEDIKGKFDPLVEGTAFDITYRNTSIFDRQSIDEMFSEGFRKISGISGIIEKILETYYQTTSARAITLTDSTGLILGHYSESENDDELLAQTALIMQTLLNYHQHAGFEKKENLELPYSIGTFLMSKIKEIGEKSYYLWILTVDPDQARENLEFFTEDLFPIIGYFFTK
jgi:GTPase SAR1 family protein